MMVSKIFYKGYAVTIDELLKKADLKTITDAMYKSDPYCYNVTLQSLSAAGFTEYELVQEYVEWSQYPLMIE